MKLWSKQTLESRHGKTRKCQYSNQTTKYAWYNIGLMFLYRNTFVDCLPGTAKGLLRCPLKTGVFISVVHLTYFASKINLL